MPGPTITLTFAGDSSKLNRSFDQVGKGANTFGDKMRKVNRVAVGASLAIGAGILSIGANAARSLGEIEKLSAQTDAAVKSMGAAWTSTAEIEAYAGELEKLTGVEAELIQGGQNLLLTFGNVQNRVGQGNDIFNQATKAMTDMSVALGQDAKSSAIQLGKALNDPIKGITALQRAGVSFTEAQRDQITALVESGKTMDAQKIILGELEKQFGGSAQAFGETMPGQIAKLQNSFGELTENMVTALMPAFQSIINLFAGVAQWALENQNTVQILAGSILALAAAVLTINAALKAYRAIMLAVIAVQIAWNIALTANPIGIVIVAIGAFVAAIVLLWNKSEAFRNFFIRAWNAHKAVVSVAVDFIRSKFNGLVEWFRGLPAKIGGFFAGIGNAIAAPFIAGFNAIRNFWNSTLGGRGFSIDLPFGLPSVSLRIPTLHQGGTVPGAPGSETLALLQAGEQVTPAGQATRTVMLRSDGSGLSDLIVSTLRQEVRRQGGNVQFVIGA